MLNTYFVKYPQVSRHFSLRGKPLSAQPKLMYPGAFHREKSRNTHHEIIVNTMGFTLVIN